MSFIHGVMHQGTDFDIRVKHQIGLEKVFRDTEILCHPVVARVLQGMTAHAIVHIQLGTTLQRRFIPGIGDKLVARHGSALVLGTRSHSFQW